MDVHPTIMDKNGIYSYWPTAISRTLQCNKLHQSTENSARPHLCRQTIFPGPFQPSLTYQLPHLPSGKRCDRHEKTCPSLNRLIIIFLQQTKAKSNRTTKLVPIASVVPLDHHWSQQNPTRYQLPMVPPIGANSTRSRTIITAFFSVVKKTPSRAATHRLRISFSPFKVLSRNSVQLSVKSSIYVHKSTVI